MYLPGGGGVGVPAQGGVPAGGCTCQGVYLSRGAVPAQNDRRCKNIALPKTSFAGGKDATSKEKEKFTLTRPQVQKNIITIPSTEKISPRLFRPFITRFQIHISPNSSEF